MTIFNPDGAEVSEIVLPDGSTASEVVAPDGTTVFPVIPDSENLQANHDALELSLSDGSIVDPWPDETDAGRDQVATSDPTYQTSIINGNPAVLGDGTDDYFSDGDYYGQQESLYWVLQTSNTSDSMGLANSYRAFTDAVEGLRVNVNGEESDLRVQYGDGTNAYDATFSLSSLQDGDPHVLGVVVDADTGDVVVNLDGTEQTASLSTLTIAHGDVYLMADGSVGTSRVFDGHIAHFLPYGVAHGAAVRSDVVSYLQLRWGF